MPNVTAPHSPYQAPQEYLDKYKDIADQSPRKVADLQKRAEALARESAKSLFLVNAFEALSRGAKGAPALPNEDACFTQGD